MIAKEIKLNDFRNFEGYHRFPLHLINLIIGKVGVGKSTMGRIAYTFCLYGYSEVSLPKLPTRWLKEPNTWVEVVFQDKGAIIAIKREIPLKITIIVNGVEELAGAGNPDKQAWIIKRFGDLEYFKKFRMIDINDGINILEEGKTGLKKILISFHESILNNIRDNIQKKKAHYEKFNKDVAVLYKHYPSVKRFEFLQAKYIELQSEVQKIAREVNKHKSEHESYLSKKGSIDNTIRHYTQQADKAKSQKNCPSCSAVLDVNLRKNIYNDAIKQINSAKSLVLEVEEGIKKSLYSVRKFQSQGTKLIERQQKLSNLKLKMEGRLKQKQYIYTNRDILLLNNALKELDKFYSFYILNCVKVLEPIINSIICKIDLEMNFMLSAKGDFDITIKKNGHEYSYKELSSGQRLLLSIAFQLAMLLDKGDVGIILADEGFNNLGEEDMVCLYEMLKDLPFQIVSIIHRFSDVSRDINIIDLNKYFKDLKNVKN